MTTRDIVYMWPILHIYLHDCEAGKKLPLLQTLWAASRDGVAGW